MRNILGLQNGSVIGNFTVISPIGSGSNGDVWAASSGPDKIALKVFKNSNEAEILHEIQKSDLFPKLIQSGQTKKYSFICIELLGPSLADLKKKYGKFNQKMSLNIGLMMLKCLAALHSMGIVHCDVKPSHFLLGEKNLKLIDFGLSKKIIEDGVRVSNKGDGRVGTVKYSSVRQLADGISEKDDLISWMYSLVELVDGKLPWDACSNKRAVENYKKTTPAKFLFHSFPNQILEIWNLINSLSYFDAPDYQFIFDKLREMINNNQHDIEDEKQSCFDDEYEDCLTNFSLNSFKKDEIL